MKNTYKSLILISVLMMFAIGIVVGINLGMPSLVKERVIELEAERVEVGGSWQVIDDDLLKHVTSSGIMIWPRQLSSPATNDNTKLQYQTGYNQLVSQQPEWNSTTKTYTYPAGTTSSDYPAFEWVQSLSYKGYGDWRLPTVEELRDLNDGGRAFITSSGLYWTATEHSYVQNSTTYYGSSWAVDFTGSSGYSTQDKSFNCYVRAVRDSTE